MGLEIIPADGTPDLLNKNWPLGTDPKSEGDDHIRNVKTVLQNFYSNSGLTRLPAGTIPAVAGNELIDVGIQLAGGQIQFDVPVTLASAVIQGLGNSFQALPPLAPIDQGAGARTVTRVVEAEEMLDIQLVDSQIASSPIGFTYTYMQNVMITELTFRGSGDQIDNVRITLRENDAAGQIVFQSATDDLLRLAGGATILAVGDSVFPVSVPTVIEGGRTFFITLDRFDTLTGEIVNTGLNLRGGTIGLEFVPYLVEKVLPWSFKEMALLEDLVVDVDDVVAYDVSSQLFSNAATLVLPSQQATLTAGTFLVTGEVDVVGADGGSYLMEVSIGATVFSRTFGLAGNDFATFRQRFELVWPADASVAVQIDISTLSPADEATKVAASLRFTKVA